MGPDLELSLCIHLEGACRILLWFSLQLCGTPPMLEAFLYGVQYLLVDPLFCAFFAGASPGQFPQQVDFVINHPNFSSGHLSTNEIHGRGFCLQISFGRGLSLVPANSLAYSFFPVAVAWVNIQCIRNGQCNPRGTHLRY